jgi:hypothetical protein
LNIWLSVVVVVAMVATQHQVVVVVQVDTVHLSLAKVQAVVVQQNKR